QVDQKAISAYCVDKIELAARGKIDPIVGRDREVRMMTEILGRRSKPNVIIVGEPGVGKTALVEGFALNIQRGDVPERLKGSRLFELDLGSLVAGASYKGEVEDRIKKVMNAIKAHDKAILFIDEIHALMDDARGLSGCADLLKPELARGELTVIGATTRDEHRTFLEPESAFMRRFELITVDEPNDRVCKQMLRTVVPIYEKHHALQVDEKALEESIRLSRRYLKERRLPDAAIDLIDRTLASIRMMNDTSEGDITRFRTRLDEVLAEDEALQLEDLRHLPVLEKRDIQERGAEMVAEGWPEDDLIRNQTGGSTGAPIRFFLCRDRKCSRAAATLRHNRWAGWREGDSAAVIWGAP
ncbi:MAG TPA: AAA family ATPase, partial [Flavobacteriales bacterium]|nr:AAA family ATPase [Flavobacteriales bacterium]